MSARVFVVKRNTRWLFTYAGTPPFIGETGVLAEATHFASKADAEKLLHNATAMTGLFTIETYTLVEADTTLDEVHVTPRQREVLKLMARGYDNAVIAKKLGISPHTAKFHATEILFALGARSRTEAVVQALRSGIIT